MKQEQIIKEFNEVINKNGVTQVHISKKTGMSKDRVSNLLNGKGKLLASEFFEMCAALNIKPDIFYNIAS